MAAVARLEQTTAAAAMNNDSSNTFTVNDADFFPLPPKQVRKSKFPNGCTVLYCVTKELPSHTNGAATSITTTTTTTITANRNHETSVQVSLAQVQQVGIDFASPARDNRYRVAFQGPCGQAQNNTITQTAILKEDQLQLAPRTLVWFTDADQKQHRGVVLSSQHDKVTSDSNRAMLEVRYAVQTMDDNDGSKTLHTNVAPHQLSFRYSGTSPTQYLIKPDANAAPPVASLVIPCALSSSNQSQMSEALSEPSEFNGHGNHPGVAPTTATATTPTTTTNTSPIKKKDMTKTTKDHPNDDKDPPSSLDESSSNESCQPKQHKVTNKKAALQAYRQKPQSSSSSSSSSSTTTSSEESFRKKKQSIAKNTKTIKTKGTFADSSDEDYSPGSSSDEESSSDDSSRKKGTNLESSSDEASSDNDNDDASTHKKKRLKKKTKPKLKTNLVIDDSMSFCCTDSSSDDDDSDDDNHTPKEQQQPMDNNDDDVIFYIHKHHQRTDRITREINLTFDAVDHYGCHVVCALDDLKTDAPVVLARYIRHHPYFSQRRWKDLRFWADQTMQQDFVKQRQRAAAKATAAAEKKKTNKNKARKAVAPATKKRFIDSDSDTEPKENPKQTATMKKIAKSTPAPSNKKKASIPTPPPPQPPRRSSSSSSSSSTSNDSSSSSSSSSSTSSSSSSSSSSSGSSSSASSVAVACAPVKPLPSTIVVSSPGPVPPRVSQSKPSNQEKVTVESESESIPPEPVTNSKATALLPDSTKGSTNTTGSTHDERCLDTPKRKRDTRPIAPSPQQQPVQLGAKNWGKNPFRSIVISIGHHLREARQRLIQNFGSRHDFDKALGYVCLPYHLKGFCEKGAACDQAQSHRRLAMEEVQELEYNLYCVTDLNGPIFCRKGIWNPQCNPFFNIKRGKCHDFVEAFRQLRNKIGKGDVRYKDLCYLFNRYCLKYHLVGFCEKGRRCEYAFSHGDLTKRDAEDIEWVLSPVIRSIGPILQHSPLPKAHVELNKDFALRGREQPREKEYFDRRGSEPYEKTQYDRRGRDSNEQAHYEPRETKRPRTNESRGQPLYPHGKGTNKQPPPRLDPKPPPTPPTSQHSGSQSRTYASGRHRQDETASFEPQALSDSRPTHHHMRQDQPTKSENLSNSGRNHQSSESRTTRQMSQDSCQLATSRSQHHSLGHDQPPTKQAQAKVRTDKASYSSNCTEPDHPVKELRPIVAPLPATRPGPFDVSAKAKVASTCFHLPTDCLDVAFVKDKVFGANDSISKKVGRDFDCNLYLRGSMLSQRPSEEESNKKDFGSLYVNIVGKQHTLLLECCGEIEQLLIIGMDKIELRGYLLYQLGIMNEKHFAVTDDVVTSPYPLPFDGSGSAGDTTFIATVSTEKGNALLEEVLRDKISLESYYSCFIHVFRHDRDYPRLKPFVLISGHKLEAVVTCRRDMLDWLVS